MEEHDIQVYRAVYYNPMMTDCESESANPPPPPSLSSNEANEDDSAEMVPVPVPDEQDEEPAMVDRLESLPPLLLTLILPIEYPLRRSPILKNVHATSDWLPGAAVTSMVKRLEEIWDAEGSGSGVLWRTCDWIRSGEFLKDIGLLQQDGVIRCASWRLGGATPALIIMMIIELTRNLSLSLSESLIQPRPCFYDVLPPTTRPRSIRRLPVQHLRVRYAFQNEKAPNASAFQLALTFSAVNASPISGHYIYEKVMSTK
jgi:hypothetical protein